MLPPLRWKVATIGGRPPARSRAYGRPGEKGSWTCTTSKRPSRSARTARTAAKGETDTGARDPFDGSGTELPDTTRSMSSGVSATSSIGANTVTRCPSAPNCRASPITCPWTPPGRDRLYGQTRAMRSARGAVSWVSVTSGQSIMDRRCARRPHLTSYMASSARLRSFEGSTERSSTRTPPTDAPTDTIRPSTE